MQDPEADTGSEYSEHNEGPGNTRPPQKAAGSMSQPKN